MRDKQAAIMKTIGVVLFAVSLVFADVGLKTVNEDISLGITGDASMSAGQAVNYYYKDATEYHHQWIQDNLLHLGMDALYSKKLEIKVNIEGRLWYSPLTSREKPRAKRTHCMIRHLLTVSIRHAAPICSTICQAPSIIVYRRTFSIQIQSGRKEPR